MAAVVLGQELDGEAPLIPGTGPLKCYQCEGPLDGDCGVDIKEVGTQMPKECLPGWDDDVDKFKLCRVIHQDVRGKLAVFRSCGYELYKNKTEESCYKTIHQEYNTLVCQCFEDGCNGANGLGGSVMLLLAVVVAMGIK
jgi:hypothetical protein